MKIEEESVILMVMLSLIPLLVTLFAPEFYLLRTKVLVWSGLPGAAQDQTNKIWGSGMVNPF